MLNPSQYIASKKRLAKAEKLLDENDRWYSSDPEHVKWREAYTRIQIEIFEFEDFYKIDWRAEYKKAQKK